MNRKTAYRENIATIRTVEKITFYENGEVQETEIVGKPVECNEDFWTDGKGGCITDSPKYYCEEAYQRSLHLPYKVRYESTIQTWLGKTRLVKNKQSARRFETEENAIAAAEIYNGDQGFKKSYCIIHG